MSLTPGARLGVYEIVGLIGAGGMGEVYRARDPRLNRDVAIKVLPASFSADRDRGAPFSSPMASRPHMSIQISTEGGAIPQWSRDGRELYYRSERYMLSVPVTMTPTTLKVGTPVRLFETAAGGDIEAAPGQRFLLNAPVQSPSLVTILVNWPEARR